jgi:hypothetical protein
MVVQQLYHRRLRARKLRGFVDCFARIIQRFIDRVLGGERSALNCRPGTVRNDVALTLQTSSIRSCPALPSHPTSRTVLRLPRLFVCRLQLGTANDQRTSNQMLLQLGRRN